MLLHLLLTLLHLLLLLLSNSFLTITQKKPHRKMRLFLCQISYFICCRIQIRQPMLLFIQRYYSRTENRDNASLLTILTASVFPPG